MTSALRNAVRASFLSPLPERAIPRKAQSCGFPGFWPSSGCRRLSAASNCPARSAAVMDRTRSAVVVWAVVWATRMRGMANSTISMPSRVGKRIPAIIARFDGREPTQEIFLDAVEIHRASQRFECSAVMRRCDLVHSPFFAGSAARNVQFGCEESLHMALCRNRLLRVAFAMVSACAFLLISSGTDSVRPRYPEDDMGKDSLPSRQKAQMETAKQFKVFYQFQFSDKLKESGITFRYRAVDDITKHMRMGHYDHGSAVAAADVDGDGLYDIYFVNQVGGNELWKNLGGGKFMNITQEAGVGLPGRISVGAAFADIDNDGDQDLFVTTVRGGNVLFENDGHGHFKDITQGSGLGLVAHSSGAFFFDYDNDGLLDLLVCNVGKYTYDDKGPDGEYVGIPNAFDGHLHPDRYEHPVLYKNMGHHHFKDVTADVGLNPHGWCGEASFSDLNGDGWPDIFFLNMQGHSHYYENQGGKKFVEKTVQYFPKTPWGAMGIKFFDYDNDGRMDLFIADMHSDMSDEPGPENEKKKSSITWTDSYIQGTKADYIWGNALYHNLGNGKFEEVSDRLGVETYWPWGPSVGDLNADGWDDIFIASGMSYPYRYGINSLLLNERGKKFVD